jgi:hypothetical protein
MIYPRLNKKLGSTVFAIVLILSVHAQFHGYSFFPVKGLALQSNALIGRIGSHFFLLNTESRNGLDVYILDTITQTGITKQYAFPKQLLSIQVNENSIVFVASSQDRTGLSYHILTLNEKGELLSKKDGFLTGMRGPAKALVSAGKQYLLFYELSKTSNDSSQLRGVLLGAGWEVKKQLRYSFKRDAELDTDPEVFLDNAGNTHVLVYDKFANYRISADVTVNSIPLAEEQIISEVFTFQKVKLKNMRVFQNNDCNCLQVEGMYVDGITKANKGLYSIAFPPGRKNELAPRFIPFNEELVKNFRKGFAATDENILKSIQLQDILYSDEGSFMILRINNGVPQKVMRINPEDDPSAKSLSRALSTSRAGDYQQPPTVALTTGVAGAAVQRTRTVPVMPIDRSASASPLLSGAPPHSSLLSSRASGRNAPKFICVKLDKDEGIQWYTSRSLDIFAADDELYNRVFFIGGEKQEVPMVLYQADPLDEPLPVLITIKGGKQMPDKFPEKKLVFSPLLYLDHFQYGSLYLNTETGIGGLMVIQTKE